MTNHIAFQGALGAYSHAACQAARPDMTPLPCDNFEDVIEAVRSGAAVCQDRRGGDSGRGDEAVCALCTDGNRVIEVSESGGIQYLNTHSMSCCRGDGLDGRERNISR